jgi:hypothetical protein
LFLRVLENLFLVQVVSVLGAGKVFGWGPAPQNRVIYIFLAHVLSLFPHLRQKISYTCAKLYLPNRPLFLVTAEVCRPLTVDTDFAVFAFRN